MILAHGQETRRARCGMSLRLISKQVLLGSASLQRRGMSFRSHPPAPAVGAPIVKKARGHTAGTICIPTPRIARRACGGVSHIRLFLDSLLCGTRSRHCLAESQRLHPPLGNLMVCRSCKPVDSPRSMNLRVFPGSWRYSPRSCQIRRPWPGGLAIASGLQSKPVKTMIESLIARTWRAANQEHFTLWWSPRVVSASALGGAASPPPTRRFPVDTTILLVARSLPALLGYLRTLGMHESLE